MRRVEMIQTMALLSLVYGWAVTGCGGSSVPETPCGTCAENAECVETLEGMKCQCMGGYTGSGSIKCTKIDDQCPVLPPLTTPVQPLPADGATDRGVADVTLSWREPGEAYQKYDDDLVNLPEQCKDTTPRTDSTTYDIYFGTTAQPPLYKKDVRFQDARGTATGVSGCQPPDGSAVCSNGYTVDGGATFQKTSYTVTEALQYGAKYYWKIVVRSQGVTAEGPIWSFSTKTDIRCQASPTVTDQDGNTYDTVQVGSQCWMNRNLAVGKLTISTQTDNGIAEKNCYKGETAADCCGFYTWNELTNYGVGSLCPSGWHVPSVAEWKLLINHPDFKRFNPQYQGYKASSNRSFGSLGGYYWSSDDKPGVSTSAQVIIFWYPTKQLDPELDSFNKGSSVLSARCLKN